MVKKISKQHLKKKAIVEEAKFMKFTHLSFTNSYSMAKTKNWNSYKARSEKNIGCLNNNQILAHKILSFKTQ